MRHIKFEAKSIHDKFGWKQGGIAISGDRVFIITPPSYPHNQESYEVIPETVSQSCDYYDDEGEEVFENDIVSVSYRGNQYEGPVYWCDVSLQFKVKAGVEIRFPLSETLRCLVTGNTNESA